MKSKRQELKQQRQRQQQIKKTTWGILAIALIAALVYAFSTAVRPVLGEEVAVMADFSHVPEGTDPGLYNSDPPTSGRHYPVSYEAGFFNEEDVNVQYPAGYLVHSLEHGYVIFWYNCELLDQAACAQLKSDIQSVMDQAGNFKVIAHPWPSIDVPLVMTSWGRILSFESFDSADAYAFVQDNRNKAPEPHAD